MKSLSKFLPLSITFLLFTIISFAQDTVKVITDSARKGIDSTLVPIVKPIVAAAETKWIWITSVLAFIVVLDHALAAIPSVKANSTFQLLTGWLTALTGGSKNA